MGWRHQAGMVDRARFRGSYVFFVVVVVVVVVVELHTVCELFLGCSELSGVSIPLQ